VVTPISVGIIALWGTFGILAVVLMLQLMARRLCVPGSDVQGVKGRTQINEKRTRERGRKRRTAWLKKSSIPSMPRPQRKPDSRAVWIVVLGKDIQISTSPLTLCGQCTTVVRNINQLCSDKQQPSKVLLSQIYSGNPSRADRARRICPAHPLRFLQHICCTRSRQYYPISVKSRQ
jgi:hypothetical protein